MKDFLVFIFSRSIAFVLGVGPLWLIPIRGKFIGWLYFRLDQKHYRRALENLDNALPEESPEARKAIAKGVFRHMGLALAEIMAYYHGPKSRLRKSCSFNDLDKLDEALAQGRGVMLIAAHMGNWEIASTALSEQNYPVSVVARPLDNPWLNRWMEKLRTYGGNVEVISKFGAVKGVLRALKKNRITAILIDQDAGDQGVFVDFFNQDASTTPTAALLAQKNNAPCLIMDTYRNASGVQEVNLIGPFSLIDKYDRQTNALENTKHFTSEIEAIIRRNPSQWLWTHRRWKTKPDTPNELKIS